MRPIDADATKEILLLYAKATRENGGNPDISTGYEQAASIIECAPTAPAVVLPCKVGDTLWTNIRVSGWYFREKDRPYKIQVVFVGLNTTKCGGFVNVSFGDGKMLSFDFSDIGKTAFLTREEAEKALEGMKHE